MIHPRQSCSRALMFDMALRTMADVHVKRGGLTLQQHVIVGMAADTFHIDRSFHGRVTGGAIVVERRMRHR